MSDQFRNHEVELNSPASVLFAITPDDNTDLAIPTRGIYVGVAGDLTVIGAGGDQVAVLIKNAGIGYHPIRASRVKSTGTTATNIVGLA